MLTTLATKEIQIKTTLRFLLTPLRLAIIKKQTTTNAGKDVGESTLIYCWWECKLVQPLWKSVLNFLKIDLPYESAIWLLDILPKEYKSIYKRDTYVYCSFGHNS
jgi:hypothetical protein